jgi:hypothetical protein
VLICPQEAYVSAPGGARRVVYLDKARLELSNPTTGTVSAGLLAKELIAGKLQLGDAEFRTLEPAANPVAGDPVDSAAPTYASFASVATLEGAQNRAERRTGGTVTQTLNRTGETGDNPALARYGVTLADYRADSGHNIPTVFTDFFARRGVIATISTADGKATTTDDQQLIDWLPVMGLPLAEPYWAEAPVGGVTRWVLMQPYERRVLTYTPDNDPAFRVEMGNIGRHYVTWRHPDGTCAERPAAPATDVPPAATQPAPAPARSPYDGNWKIFSSYFDDVEISVDGGSVREIAGLVRNGNCRVRFSRRFTYEQGRIDERGAFFVRADWDKFSLALTGTFASPKAAKGTGEFDMRISGCRGAVGFGWEARPEP